MIGGAGFVGRVRELGQLRADIERAGLHTLSGRPSPHSRVLLIAGRPGSGRTALAEEFVRRVAGRYPDGVLRARLTDPGGTPVPTERTARDLLAALGGEPAPPGADEDELTEVLRRELAERRVLLLLDDVASAEQLLDLLPDSRECLIVAVSSGPLTGVPDVRPCTPGGLERAQAVALLRGRAGATPRITVDPRSAEALAQECGDLPMALCLAGGWLGDRPKLSLADAIAQLAALPGADPLERAFRLVNEGLGSSARRMLRLLALAPAGHVDAQIASALTGVQASAAQATLTGFLRLGLLHRSGQPGASGPESFHVPGCLDPLLRAELAEHERPAEVMLARATMLERIVRQLRVCHAVTEPEGSEARQRLARVPRALRFPDVASARRWLESRRPALLAAARMAVAEGEGQLDTLARRLVSCLDRAFEAHLRPEEAAPEAYRLHELVLGVADRLGLHRERATALLALGDLDAGTGRHQQALTRYRSALDAARATRKDGELTNRALESIGGTYAELADWARAADWYGRALSLRQARGERAAAARLHSRIGAVHTWAGRYDEALREWRAAAAACRRLRDVHAYARALSEVARVQEQAGREREARRSCRHALEAARRAGDERLQAALRLRLAEGCDRAGDPAAGRAHRAEADRLLHSGSTDGSPAVADTVGDRSSLNGFRGQATKSVAESSAVGDDATAPEARPASAGSRAGAGPECGGAADGELPVTGAPRVPADGARPSRSLP
ncbi:tetratricopeptide repeat protein [Streptomyces sp. HNM0574]|uniref:tetratricopeptide repeat protein n=1 Tax=Streptomyces sp. HNM0574 TaxID=2714954 RepID=UPI003217F21B